jgi:plastocyanin
MRRRRLGSVAGVAGGAALLATLHLTTLPGPLPTTAAYVPPPGARVSMEETAPDCGRTGVCYTPAEVGVGTGGTVTWFNNTGSPHTVTRCRPATCSGNGPGSGPDNLNDSGEVVNGATWFFTFRGAGTYLYYCTVDGYRAMHGWVIVRDTGPQATPTPAQPLGVPLPALPPLPGSPLHHAVGAGRPPGAAAARTRTAPS